MRRRDASPPGRYATSGPDGEIPDPVLRWQHHVHQPGIYDLEIDTSTLTEAGGGGGSAARLTGNPEASLRRLAEPLKELRGSPPALWASG